MRSILFLCGCLVLIQTTESRVVKENGEDEKQDPCANVFCHTGQECIVEEGTPSCQCLSECPGRENPVCGSDGITYPSHCELHRTACVHSKKITIKNKGSCEEILPTIPPTGKVNMSKPVVCYEHDRDDMRGRLIEWLRLRYESLQGEEGYRKSLKLYFDMMDKNNDSKLDIKEFEELIKTNLTVANIRGADEYTNPILQVLCTDALIAITDEDSDWELDFDEFIKCLDPDFRPPKKSCELEGDDYKDGAEIPTECNSCVCACGKWVCTALNCDELLKSGVEKSFGRPLSTGIKSFVTYKTGKEGRPQKSQLFEKGKNKKNDKKTDEEVIITWALCIQP